MSDSSQKLKETVLKECSKQSMVTQRSGISSIDKSFTCSMIVLPMYSCFRQNGESGFYSPIFTPPPTIAYLFTFCSYCPLLVVNGSIEYHCTVGLCTDSSTIRVYRVVSKIACSTEVQSRYFILRCEYCYTTFLSLLLMKLLVPCSDVLFDVSIPPPIY